MTAALVFDRLFLPDGIEASALGPFMPPMIAWQRRGEPGWPFHWPEWLPPREAEKKLGEQLGFDFRNYHL